MQPVPDRSAEAVRQVSLLDGVRRVEAYPIPLFKPLEERAFAFTSGPLAGKGVFIVRSEGDQSKESAILERIKAIAAAGHFIPLQEAHFHFLDVLYTNRGVSCFFGKSSSFEGSRYSVTAQEVAPSTLRTVLQLGEIQLSDKNALEPILEAFSAYGYEVESHLLYRAPFD